MDYRPVFQILWWYTIFCSSSGISYVLTACNAEFNYTLFSFLFLSFSLLCSLAIFVFLNIHLFFLLLFFLSFSLFICPCLSAIWPWYHRELLFRDVQRSSPKSQNRATKNSPFAGIKSSVLPFIKMVAGLISNVTWDTTHFLLVTFKWINHFHFTVLLKSSLQ